MDIHTLPRAHRRWLAAGLLAGLVIVVLAMFSPAPSPRGRHDAAVAFDPLSRVHVDGREWLLVTDRQSGLRTIYDASDGRPLCQLDSAPPDADRLAACADGSPTDPRRTMAATR